MFTRRQVSTAIALSPILASPAFAKTFPTRPVKLILPYAAGGGTDAIARVVAQAMTEKLGQAVVIENISTGGGNVATATAAAAAPDGYTMLMANQGPIAVNPHIMKTVTIDTLTAFDAVTQVAETPLVVVVPDTSRYKTFAELLGAMQQNPGKLSYGSAGNGSASHLATLLLAHLAKVDVVHIPYRGAGPAISDVLGGQTDFIITTVPSVSGLIDSGKMRPLAVTTKRRAPTLKDVPTVAESGLPDYEINAWYGFIVPAGTPRALIDLLRQATIDALGSPLVRDRLDKDGAEPIGSTPEQFSAFIKSEHARWKAIAAAANIQIN
ncbi:tripartite tricarboxylate transporter substrate-binding protein [Bradyrhizobium sp. LHD-71]|uniref:Bug family tripartite tricarboxylate transporter substrate binding protein n=1 Tax=Bradyrhizobium sp. LHD-71 TaxID=3072141 RepID=UPI00280EA5F9|nr:tripartite tricarboxylate transporter substrate-binding protein [Bradyrhizobium sp. LHD-71]MDQ8727846.1 tripartite tricarboxylate transporter substrate-binding protein [Bradyrhizobium sp. LHD-71]